jgi:FAD/FMN-containing dehydrogenase
MGRLQLGLALDLSKLNSISVDSEAATLTVGGGTRTGDIMGPVHEAGFELRALTAYFPAQYSNHYGF